MCLILHLNHVTVLPIQKIIKLRIKRPLHVMPVGFTGLPST